MKDLKISNPLKQCLPKASEAAYPPDTCAQYCVFPFYCGILMQIIAIAAGVSIVFSIWLFYGLEKAGRNYDDSLVYRISLTGLTHCSLTSQEQLFHHQMELSQTWK